MSTKVSTHTVGSWFPSGYYGHYRNRVRTDFVNEYRQLAKPQPPERFIYRASILGACPCFSHVYRVADGESFTGILDHEYPINDHVPKPGHAALLQEVSCNQNHDETEFSRNFSSEFILAEHGNHLIRERFEKQPPSSHVFSLHDNRQAIMRSSYYAPETVGRRRYPKYSDTFDPNFISWPQSRTNPKVGRPLTSTYRHDFRMEEPAVEKLIKRPLTSFDNVLTTTYCAAHGSGSPNRDLINAMNNDALMATINSRKNMMRMKQSGGRETVASCMSWHRPRVPQATYCTLYSNCVQPLQEPVMSTNNSSAVMDTLPANEGQTVTSVHETLTPEKALTE